MPQPIFKRKAARTQKLRLRLPVAFSMDLERCKVLRRSMCFLVFFHGWTRSENDVVSRVRRRRRLLEYLGRLWCGRGFWVLNGIVHLRVLWVVTFFVWRLMWSPITQNLQEMDGTAAFFFIFDDAPRYHLRDLVLCPHLSISFEGIQIHMHSGHLPRHFPLPWPRLHLSVQPGQPPRSSLLEAVPRQGARDGRLMDFKEPTWKGKMKIVIL